MSVAEKLPERYLITGKAESEEHFFNRLEQALQSGIKLFQYRAPELSGEEYLQRAHRVVSLAHNYEAKVLLNGDPAWVSQVGADGVHLNGGRLSDYVVGSLEMREIGIISASCHNRKELEMAAQVPVSFALLSAVLPTQTHPDRAPLGWDKFSELVSSCTVPVYALGGVTSEHIQQAQQLGGQGVAAITAFWVQDKETLL